MVTDKQRREVAARIKALPDDMYSKSLELLNDGILDLRAQDTADYYEIYYALFGAFPADNQHPNDFRELHKLLADLIDRTTCEFKPFYGPDLMGEVSLVECTACAWTIEPWNAYEFRYCPMCGAEVIRIEDL